MALWSRIHTSLAFIMLRMSTVTANGVQFAAVATAVELQNAVVDSITHVVISDHFDVQGVRPSDGCLHPARQYGMDVRKRGLEASLYCIQPGTLSIQGNCSSESRTALEDGHLLRPNQCLLNVEQAGRFIHLSHSKQKLWLQGLYLRLGDGLKDAVQLVDLSVSGVSVPGPHLYMSAVTMHGNDAEAARGIRIYSAGSKLFASDVALYDLCSWPGAAFQVHAGSVALERSEVSTYHHHRSQQAKHIPSVLLIAGAMSLYNTKLESIDVFDSAVVFETHGDHQLADAPHGLFLSSSDPWLQHVRAAATQLDPSTSYQLQSGQDGADHPRSHQDIKGARNNSSTHRCGGKQPLQHVWLPATVLIAAVVFVALLCSVAASIGMFLWQRRAYTRAGSNDEVTEFVSSCAADEASECVSTCSADECTNIDVGTADGSALHQSDSAHNPATCSTSECL